MINSLKRRDYISKLFKDSNISFIFFNAFDGFAYTQNDFERLFNLSSGEIGCLYSHLNLYKKIIDENIQEAIILEDDIILSKSFLKFHENWIKCKKKPIFDILKLGYSDSQYFIYDQPVNVNVFTTRKYCKLNISRPNEISFGSYAYVITNNGARQMIKLISKKLAAIDVLLHESPTEGVNLYVATNQNIFPNFSFDSLIRDVHTHLIVTSKTKDKMLLNHTLSLFKKNFYGYLKSDFYPHLNNHD